jgi:hypothetical protein
MRNFIICSPASYYEDHQIKTYEMCWIIACLGRKQMHIRISGSNSGGYEGYRFLGYKAM